MLLLIMGCVHCRRRPKVLNKEDKCINHGNIYRHKLALDIDETLIHSTYINNDEHQAVIHAYNDNYQLTHYVYVRPYAREFIIYLGQYYDVYFYSASSRLVILLISTCRLFHQS